MHESSSSSDSQQLNLTADSLPEFDSLGPDLIELILSLLPTTSIIHATSVCKSWNSIIRSVPFKTRLSNSKSLPWFFICGQEYHTSTNNPAFGFCPESDEWIKLPTSTLPFKQSFTASNGLFFTISPEKFRFRPALANTWQEIAPLIFSESEHLVGVYKDPDFSDLTRFFVIGTAAGDMPVNIYDPRSGLWEACPSPPQLGVWDDINTLSLSLFRNKFYLFAITAGFTWSFDLQSRTWSNVQRIRPESIEFSYLFSFEDQLVLAGLCSVNRDPEFNLWRVDETAFKLTKIGVMPEDLLSDFFGRDRERRYARLKCVASGNVVYISSKQREGRPACICEISSSGKCSWRRIPDLPGLVPPFLWRVVHFCCSVSVQHLLGN